MEPERVRVEAGERIYDVYVGAGLLDRLDDFLRGEFRRGVLVADCNVGPLYAPPASRCLQRAGIPLCYFEVPAGESSKSLQAAADLLEFMLESGLERGDLVVALGGGVVGDLAGFAASVYKRGCPILQVPTTLMSQVDSSIGGKTGVNLPSAKNMVGTFHHPVAVVADVAVLSTLPRREYLSGLAEVAKYRFLEPGSFAGPLEEMASLLSLHEPEALGRVVKACAGIKARVVGADPYDTGGRAVLNYGHTLGHALEAATGYGKYTHGEAVSVGMVYAALVSERMGLAEAGLASRHRRALLEMGLPCAPLEEHRFGDLLESMRHDKKRRGETVMVLLEEEGRPHLVGGVGEEVLESAYRALVSGE